MKPKEPDKVKLFFGILYSDTTMLEKMILMLEKAHGKLDFRSKPFNFDITDYYVSEMGSPIYRIFLSFCNLINPNEISSIKVEVCRIEDSISIKGKRKVNLDPGYMDYDKVVLASTKYNGQKVYLDNGIWADLTLFYERGRFHTYAWSFPDFKQGIYDEVFMEIRTIYKTQRRSI